MTTPAATATRRRHTVGQRARSTVVVAAIVVAVILLVPRPNSLTQAPVDVAGTAVAVSGQLSFTPAVPSGLSRDWQPTSAHVLRSTDHLLDWHIGYVTPSGGFASIEQVRGGTADWLHAQTSDGALRGLYFVAGTTWDAYRRIDRGTNSLVLQVGGVTTVVTGSVGYAELAELAASLRLHVSH